MDARARDGEDGTVAEDRSPRAETLVGSVPDHALPAASDASGRQLVDHLVKAGVALALVGAAVYLVARGINQLLLPAPSTDFDPGGEGNPFAWATTVATFAAGLAAALHALASPWRRGWFALLAITFAFLSLSDAIELHERAGEKILRHGLGLPDTIASQGEFLFYGPLFAFAVLSIWSLARHAPRTVGRIGRAAVVTLGVAIALELVGAGTRQLGDEKVVNQVRNGLEDAAEISGWTLLATFMAAVLCTKLVEIGRARR